MRNDPLPFNFVVSNGGANEESKPIITGHYWGHAIQIDGTFVANVAVKVRLSKDVDYIDVQTVSNKALITLQYPVESILCVISGYASGQVKAVYAGYKIR
jgi:hypothetical protein